MNITWSPSGEEVTFISYDLRIAYAHHVQSGATRQLYASGIPGGQIYDAALSADGAEWFTSSFGTGGFVIRRHTPAGSTVLTDRGKGGLHSPADGRAVLVAAEHPAAAFIVSPDSLFLLRRGGEPTALGTGCDGVMAFSPQGSRVVCRAGFSPRIFRIFRTDGGAPESLNLPDHVAGTARVIRWDAQGIQVLYSDYADGTRYLLYEQASGSSRPLTPAYKYPESTEGVSWSSDGRKVAYWNSYCAQSEGLLSCRTTQAFLYVLDVAGGTARRVAVHTLGSGWVGQVAVSPTGSAVAYTVNGGFYLLETR